MSKPAESQRMSESELVLLARTGCNEAFAELVRKHHRDLRGFLVRRVGNLATADDLAQDVFLAAVKQISTLDDDRCFRSWLFSVARNKVIDHFRRASRETTNNELEELIVQENIARAQPFAQPFAEPDSEPLMNALQECISKLNPSASSLVESFYFQNNSAEQIASTSGKNGNTIRMSLLRIRKALAVCIRRRIGTEFVL